MLEVRLRGVSELAFQAQTDRHGVSLPVIMMTGYGDIQISVRAMTAGAVDFLAKPFRDQDIRYAVAVALQRDRAARVAKGDSAPVQSLYATLRPREQQLMAQVTAARPSKQIAG